MPAYVQDMDNALQWQCPWPTRLKPVTLLQTGCCCCCHYIDECIGSCLQIHKIGVTACMPDNVNSRKWSELFYILYVHICVSSQSLPLALETTRICDCFNQCCREGVMCTLILPAFRLRGKNYTTSGKEKKNAKEDLWEKPQPSMCMPNVLACLSKPERTYWSLLSLKNLQLKYEAWEIIPGDYTGKTFARTKWDLWWHRILQLHLLKNTIFINHC